MPSPPSSSECDVPHDPLPNPDKQDACSFKVDEESLEGRVCYGDLDLSSTTDITAFVLVFPPLDEDDKFCILPYFWIPEDTLELRVRRDHVPYDVWERQGFLQTTDGNVVHYGYIEKIIERLGERFNIREIAFDRWGAVATIMGLDRAIRCGNNTGASVYDDRGILFI